MRKATPPERGVLDARTVEDEEGDAAFLLLDVGADHGGVPEFVGEALSGFADENRPVVADVRERHRAVSRVVGDGLGTGERHVVELRAEFFGHENTVPFGAYARGRRIARPLGRETLDEFGVRSEPAHGENHGLGGNRLQVLRLDRRLHARHTARSVGDEFLNVGVRHHGNAERVQTLF